MYTQAIVGLGLSQERKVQSKLSWVPLQGIGAGGRELLLLISMCCVCPSLRVAGKRFQVGAFSTASVRGLGTHCKLQTCDQREQSSESCRNAEMLRLLCSKDWALTLHLGGENSLESTMNVYE